MRKKFLVGFLVVLFLVCMSGMANAITLFSENFEGGLLDWTGQGGGPHSGQTVLDPLGSGMVLNFTNRTSGGDIFSSQSFLSTNGGKYELSFDYLGVPGQGTPGNLGGVAGYSEGFPDIHVWLAGTTLGGGILDDPLIDDGAWHRYIIPFQVANINLPIHVMFEDFVGPPEDAYFDNIKLTDAVPAVPEPTTFVLLGIGLIGMAGAEAKRRRKKKAIDKS